MNKLVLESMHLENFKGIRDMTVPLNPSMTRIQGRNGSGKSTIADAFYWVLFNTDSKGNAPGSDKFREKPLDDDGQEKHGLDTVVELDFTLNDNPFHVKRTQREVWSKKRGFADEVFGGNESTYQINGVDVKSTDFKKRLAEIASIDTMELLASLGEFNRRPWKERRTTLLSLCDVDVDAILLASGKYAEIADECATAGVSVEDLRKVVDDRRKAINKELQMTPVRIDEATKALPDPNSRELQDAEYLIADSQKDIDKINQTIADLMTEGTAASAHAKIAELENEAAAIKRSMADELARSSNEANAQMTALRATKQRTEGYISDAWNRLRTAQSDVELLTKQRDALRADFHTVAAQVIIKKTTCDKCGQPIPESMSDEMYEKEQADKVAAKLDIQERGKAKAAELEAAEKRVEEITADIDELKKQVQTVDAQLNEAAKEFAKLGVIPDYSKNPRLAEIAQEIADLNTTEIADTDSKIAGLRVRRDDLQGIINRKRAVIAKYEAAKETEKRIEDLKEQQVKLGKDLAKTEKTLMRIEEFIRERCSMVTESVNKMFPTVRWKLFNTLINGGIEDVCTCMIPCESGLVTYESANTASQMSADVEIIKTMSDIYGVKLPLFVDGAERANLLPYAGTQTVVLAVGNGELTIE